MIKYGMAWTPFCRRLSSQLSRGCLISAIVSMDALELIEPA